jgi:hypothetical protein
MNDAPLNAPVKRKRSLVLPIGGAILLLLLLGFFASRAGLDKALVKQQVDDFIVQLKEKGEARGRNVVLSYKEIDVAGGLLDKHVVILEPVLSIQPLHPESSQGAGEKQSIDALRFTTAALHIQPKSSDLSALQVVAKDPIGVASIAEPEKPLLTLTASEAFKVDIGQLTEANEQFTATQMTLPAELKFVYLRETQAEGQEDTTPTLVPVYETLTLNTAPGGTVSGLIAQQESELGEIKVALADIVLTPEKAPEGSIRIARFDAQISNRTNEKAMHVMKAFAAIGPVTSAAADMPYQPIQLNLDATFEGAAPQTPQAAASAAPQEAIMTLKQFSLTTKDASVQATANFTSSAGDVLPVGNATLSLSNVPYVLAELRSQGILDAASDAMVGAVLERISGLPLAELKDLTIPIERAKGGAFKIGNSTAEELFALLLQQALQQPGAVTAAPVDGVESEDQGAVDVPLVPQLPDADAPKAAPIAVPDPSVRG